MKVAILILYFAVLVAIGIYCRKSATDVNGFVLGGRNVLFFGRHLCRLRRTVRLEVRDRIHLDRARERGNRLAARLDQLRETDPYHDTAFEFGDHAAVFREAF